MPKSRLDNLLGELEEDKVNTNEIDKSSSLTYQEILDRNQDREERKKYAFRTFIFLCGFTGLVLSIIIAAGFSKLIGFELHDSVLIALITSSLATIVGIFILVMRYLFK
ncbi:hypothetical protein [Tenacibaculum xiamenense]|uniref:hypothetical protein n=1 Tax=Tenacibaculum xiamenense TaxID=1261553 RepID=UPI003893522C